VTSGGHFQETCCEKAREPGRIRSIPFLEYDHLTKVLFKGGKELEKQRLFGTEGGGERKEPATARMHVHIKNFSSVA
jgi:hypothetical protein